MSNADGVDRRARVQRLETRHPLSLATHTRVLTVWGRMRDQFVHLDQVGPSVELKGRLE